MTLSQFNPHPVQWYEGMFLVPQHFQQADLRLHNLWQYHLSHLAPYYWGISNMTIDTAQLVGGVFKVVSLEAVMPDGTVFFFPDSPTDSLSLSLADLPQILDSEPFKIHICLPLMTPEDTLGSDNTSRYISIESTPVKDMNTGESPVTITHLKPRASLIAGTVPTRSTSIPLIEMVKVGEKFSPTAYLPPQITVPLDSPLGTSFMGLTKRVRDKLIYLQNKIQNHLPGMDNESDRIFATLEAMRQNLVVGLLSFEAIFNTNKAHPFELFKALSAFVAHGIALRRGLYPPAFPPYCHDNLWGSFEPLLVSLDDVLNNIEEAYVNIPLHQQDRVFSLELDADYMAAQGSLVFAARAQPGSTEDALISWIEEAVITTDSSIDRVQENRVLGAERQVVHTIPSLSLSASRGLVLFTVSKDTRFIVPGEVLRIFNISDTPRNRPQQIIFHLPNLAS